MCTHKARAVMTKYFDLRPQGILSCQILIDDHRVTRISLGLVAPSSIRGRSISPKKELLELLSGHPPFTISFSHYTPFQKKVLAAVQGVEFGTTATYADIAKSVGCKSPRAVGMALAANNTPLLIPCHRIVRKDGNIGGFSQGIEVKRLLLRFEDENRRNE